MINLILLGLPGAGKGTASERIVDKYELSDIYRQFSLMLYLYQHLVNLKELS